MIPVAASFGLMRHPFLLLRSRSAVGSGTPRQILPSLFYVMLSLATFSRKGCGCANVLPTVASISYISKDPIPMTVSMYQASAPIFVQFLTSLCAGQGRRPCRGEED